MAHTTIEIIIAGIMALLILGVLAVLTKADSLQAGTLLLFVAVAALILGLLAGVLLVTGGKRD